MSLAPIVLFVYNRPWHTKQTVEALQKNELASESALFIYSDASKNEEAKSKVQRVRDYIKTIDGFRKVTIVERDRNWGLADSIIDGVTKVVNEYGKIIVLEDDLVTSPYFLKFMNDGLNIYQNSNRVGMIHAHMYLIPDLPELFFSHKIGCLGWGTWVDRWGKVSFDGEKLLRLIKRNGLMLKFNMNNSYAYCQMLKDQIKGRNSSWAIRMYASFLLEGLLAFYPGESLVEHIGYHGGTHCNSGTQSAMDGKITSKKVICKRIKVANSQEANEKITKFYNNVESPAYKRLLVKFLKITNMYNPAKKILNSRVNNEKATDTTTKKNKLV